MGGLAISRERKFCLFEAVLEIGIKSETLSVLEKPPQRKETSF